MNKTDKTTIFLKEMIKCLLLGNVTKRLIRKKRIQNFLIPYIANSISPVLSWEYQLSNMLEPNDLFYRYQKIEHYRYEKLHFGKRRKP